MLLHILPAYSLVFLAKYREKFLSLGHGAGKSVHRPVGRLPRRGRAGQPGGAKLPVDRRLRLDPCDGPLDLSWFGRDQRSVQVVCPQRGWKIYVAVDGAASTPARRSAQTGGFSGETIVNRGEGVTILARGSGFTLTRQGEALEAGAMGEWIKIRPVGDKKAVLRAQGLRPGQVGMELP